MKKVLFFFAFIVSINLHAQLKHNTNTNKYGVAIDTYDPVSYFQHRPMKGNKNIKSYHNGATYFFSNEVNKEIFDKNPTAYEPQYGGWCAYAIGKTNENVEIDPKTFKIKDGKLYLFYNKLFTNTLDLWNKEETSLFQKAEQNWKQSK